MSVNHFPPEVIDVLGSYVYRLVDPRNGETFYVGKGKGQRIFDHVRGTVADSEQDPVDPKLERIREIQGLGTDVEHIIHRHGMSDAMAREVEAALIDAYPGLVNRMSGSGSRDRGTRHADEIVLEYSAEEFTVEEPLILISIGRSWKERSVYEAVRGLWKMDMERARDHKLVLAHVRGVVKGAYRPTEWFTPTRKEFPPDDHPQLAGRIGFNGDDAEPETWAKYVGKRVPQKHRKRGSQAPFRYLYPLVTPMLPRSYTEMPNR